MVLNIPSPYRSVWKAERLAVRLAASASAWYCIRSKTLGSWRCSMCFTALWVSYGWWAWGSASEDRPLTRFPLPKHLLLLAIGVAVTGLLVWAMRYWQVPGTHQGMEAFIASFAIIATWLMSAKAVENRDLRTIGDVAAVAFISSSASTGTLLLNVVYIGLAVAGYIR
ncbi:MAG: nicotinamide mononucleotide transporter [Flavobacteriales bacterium]|nr:nicotinamide mononucleotide transporter [Flavobacteriales bacterium]